MAESDAATGCKTSLLDLPPEIWSKIVKLAVEKDLPINIFGRYANGVPSGRQAMSSELSITAVCRIIRAEALPHYYEANAFYCLETWRIGTHNTVVYLQEWLKVIGKTNARALRPLYYIGSPEALLEAEVLCGSDGSMRTRPVSRIEFDSQVELLPRAGAHCNARLNNMFRVEIA